MGISRSKIYAVGASITCLAFAACSLDVHDNTVNIPNAKISVTTNADVDHVTPGEMMPLTLNTTNVYLVDPATTPPAEHASDAGHVQIYLDDVATPPILITAQVMVTVTVPAATPMGKHKFICRVHKHDGTPTTTTFEVTFTVSVGVVPVDMAAVPHD